uniref:NACHT domain-containing protein n=1 Tax=Herbidospora sakaeratensis TaxID=564415 RepID=UPI00078452B3|nr:NACHT domain-containing protein [Herbidospora sakaeratensis]
MARRSGSWRHTLGWWAGLAGVTGLLALTGSALRGTDGLQTAANVAQLAGVILVVPTLLVPLWLWWRRSTVRPAVTSAHVDHAKDVLAGLIEHQWNTEARMRSVDDPSPIPVRWRLTRTSGVMDHPANLTPGLRRLSVHSDDIVAAARTFRRLRRRRLVILGDPGTGKTTLAIQLIRELLATRGAHPGEPVPVLMSVADWDTRNHPRLHQWLAVRLEHDYPALRAADLPAEMPAALATRGHVLPVLDGLDELSPPARQAVIVALNQSLADTDQLIVTSRTAEFSRAVEGAGDVLTSAMVIEPRALTPKTAAAYLERCLPPRPAAGWEEVLAVLRATPAGHDAGRVLATIAGTALGLWLLRVVYIDDRADPAPLTEPGRFPDTARLKGHLLDRLIPALIATRTPGADPADPFLPHRRHDPHQARRWLTYLARTMAHPLNGTPTRDFAWWDLARRTRAFTAVSRLAIAGAVTVVVASVVAAGLVVVYDPLFEITIVIAITVGLVGGLAVGLLSGSWPLEEPGFANLRLHGRRSLLARRLAGAVSAGIAAGIVVGGGVGIIVGIRAGLDFGFEAALPAGGVFGLLAALVVGAAAVVVFVLVAGFMGWVETPAAADRARAPMSSWQADRALNLVRIDAVVLGVGITFGGMGAAAGLRDGPVTALVAGLVLGLVPAFSLGLVGGLVGGNHHAWPAYAAATCRLAWSGRLPRALMPFLDDAHRLGLLRAVGPFYQFRHADLQDHLAAGPPG